MRGAPRARTLEARWRRLQGVYVPALYPSNAGRADGAERRSKCRASCDSTREFPAEYIVPFTQQVHDRIGLEVMRGCTHGCRFCQAGMTTRPVRERRLDNVDALMDRLIATTGYEEVSLLSLSTCDYRGVRALLPQGRRARRSEENVAV